MERLDCFDLDDNSFTHEQIETIAAIKLHTLVFDGLCQLPLEWNAAQREFTTKTFFVSPLQEPRTERAMNLNRRPNDFSAQRIFLRLCALCVSVV